MVSTLLIFGYQITVQLVTNFFLGNFSFLLFSLLIRRIYINIKYLYLHMFLVFSLLKKNVTKLKKNEKIAKNKT